MLPPRAYAEPLPPFSANLRAHTSPTDSRPPLILAVTPQDVERFPAGPFARHSARTTTEAVRLIERWRPLMQALIAELGADADYWEVFDPYDLAHPVQGSLADDLADVFIDLDEGLRRWDRADFDLRRAIVWEWRFSYENHWGRHAIGAMRAIHALLYLHRIGDEEEDDTG
jgi:hypothetical protein